MIRGPVVARLDPECWCDWVGSDTGGWTMTERDVLCPVHFTRPWWCPTRLAPVLRYWRHAARDPEHGQLTFRQWGDSRRGHWVEHGWWLNPTLWGLGVEWADDWRRHKYGGDGGVMWLAFQVGPFSWSVGLHQPYVEPPAPKPSYTIRPGADLSGL